MKDHHRNAPAPFGTQLGLGPGDVPVYSSDYDSVDRSTMPDRRSFSSRVGDVFMGYKWQCVELARRWMYLTKGYVFDDIAMAYDIFRLRHVRRIEDGTLLPLHSFRNGSPRRPEPGCLMIWAEGGEFEVTGHVAVVTEVTDRVVRVIEQNVEDTVWPQGNHCSRELPTRIDDEGRYWVDCTYIDGEILGWVVQTENATHAEPQIDADAALFDIGGRQIQTAPRTDWLDRSQPENEAFCKMMGGARLATRDEDLSRYFVISETAQKELTRATNELHAMFLHATAAVLEDDALLARFNLPQALLPRIKQSWDNRRTHVITGRFDFAMSSSGMKVYEYNVDSGSCHMETGRVQGAWAQAHGIGEDSRDPGYKLHRALVRAWQDSHVEGVLHILRDDDPEEIYHALYMKSALEAAGVRCKLIDGVAGLRWDDEGRVLDADGERIDWVWKTWAWETALDQLRDEAEDEDAFLASHEDDAPRDHAPRLIDVLLRPEVMVFEPLWTLIPSNKAILPVLWSMFPNHPYLLESSFEMTDTLATRGYVSKPIVGRCGRNITLVDRRSAVLEETGGQFDDRDMIYQELFKLPEIDGLRVQVCTFSVDGRDAGTCVRCDPSLVITSDSDVLPLRIVPDEAVLD